MSSENKVEFKGCIEFRNYFCNEVFEKKVFLFARIIGIMLIPYFILTEYKSYESFNIKFILVFSVVALICIIPFPLFVSKLSTKLCTFMLNRDYYYSNRDKSHTYTINNNGIEVKKINETLLIKFSDIKNIVQYDDLYVISIKYRVYNTKTRYLYNSFIFLSNFFIRKTDEENFRNILEKNNINIENVKKIKRAR